MKGLVSLGVFALFYLLIIILFNEVASEPRGVSEGENVGQFSGAGANSSKQEIGASNGTSSTKAQVPQEYGGSKFGNDASTSPSKKEKPVVSAQQRAVPDSNQQNSDLNPLADLFQITDPAMRTALGAIYGSYNGNDQCSRKAFCMLGNYMKNMPGRDLIFYMMGQYIPTEYNLYYEIFKIAVLYGQNCEVYVCIADAGPPDAASAAARPNTSTPTTTTTPKPSQQQQKQQEGNTNSVDAPFPKSPSLSNAFPRK